MKGSLEIRSLKLSDGFIRLIQFNDGTYNIARALSSAKETEDNQGSLTMDIKSIYLNNIDLIKINEK